MPRLALYALADLRPVRRRGRRCSLRPGQLAGDRVGAAGRTVVQHDVVLRAARQVRQLTEQNSFVPCQKR